MQFKNVAFLTQAAMISAIYVVLTLIFHPISYGEIQVRISEALTILPLLTPAAVPGVFAGCLIANILGGGILPDIVFGSLATLTGTIFTYLLRNRPPILGSFPPIVANSLIIPFVLCHGYGIQLPIPFMMLTVGIGEILSCSVLGMILYSILKKHNYIFRFHETSVS